MGFVYCKGAATVKTIGKNGLVLKIGQEIKIGTEKILISLKNINGGYQPSFAGGGVASFIERSNMD